MGTYDMQSNDHTQATGMRAADGAGKAEGGKVGASSSPVASTPAARAQVGAGGSGVPGAHHGNYANNDAASSSSVKRTGVLQQLFH